MCFATTCVHVYSISPHDPLEFEIDVIDLIISILSFFLLPHSVIFSHWRKNSFDSCKKRGNDCLQISTILLYLCHFWCITILSISKIKWNMYRFTNLREWCQQSEQDYGIVTTACLRCFFIYYIFLLRRWTVSLNSRYSHARTHRGACFSA